MCYSHNNLRTSEASETLSGLNNGNRIYIYVIVINRSEVYSGVIRTDARGR